MKPFIHFEHVTYDVPRLQAELAALEETPWQEHFAEGHYTGGWKAAPLISVGGAMDKKALERSPAGRYEKTPLLARCPYIEEIIDSFKCEKQRVRLMRMTPGTVIKPHIDFYTSWPWGIARMHIPITTNDQVYFLLDGQRLLMRPGQLWYVDIYHTHAVRNEGPTIRTHLVLDLVVNDFLRQFFPPESFGERAADVAIRWRQRATVATRSATRRVRNALSTVYRLSGARALYHRSGLRDRRAGKRSEP